MSDTPAPPRMNLEPVVPGNVDRAARLFSAYPFKTAQRVVQKLDRERLDAFYLAGLRRGAEAGRPAWFAYDVEWPEAGPVALGGLEPESWHGGIYGMRMGKIQPWLNALDPPAGEALLETVRERARADGIEHLSVRIDGEDFANLHLFERAGFLLIDVSMKFSRAMPFGARVWPEERPGWRVRLATPDDAEWMRRLGAREHAHTHFLNDPALPREKTQELFGAWVARCIEKLAWRIHVLEDAQGRGRGFVIYLRNRALRDAVGANPIILDYVILEGSARGGGVGPWFVQESLVRESEETADSGGGFDYCELRTSQHNHAAIGAYEKLGFRLCATDFVLHGRP